MVTAKKTTKKTSTPAPKGKTSTQAPSDDGLWNIPIPEGADLTGGGGLPVGSYLMKCIDEPQRGVSKQKQNPQIIFQMECIDPGYPEFEGKQGKIYCSLQPAAWWFLTNLLDAFEVEYEIITKPDPNNPEKEIPVNLKFNPIECVGRTALCDYEPNSLNPNRTQINMVRHPNDAVENLDAGEDSDGDEGAGGDTFECPSCKGEVAEEDKKCPHCGVEFDD